MWLYLLFACLGGDGLSLANCLTELASNATFFSAGLKFQNDVNLGFIFLIFVLVAQQKLLYLGKIMKDPAQLKEYKISEGAKVNEI